MCFKIHHVSGLLTISGFERDPRSPPELLLPSTTRFGLLEKKSDITNVACQSIDQSLDLVFLLKRERK